eukprot:1584425-Karenia_brevis.AAC.1
MVMLSKQAAMAAKMRPIVEDADAAVNTTPGPPSKTPSFAEAIDDIQSNLEQAKQQVHPSGPWARVHLET